MVFVLKLFSRNAAIFSNGWRLWRLGGFPFQDLPQHLTMLEVCEELKLQDLAKSLGCWDQIPLVMTTIAIENGHRNSGFTH